MGPGQPGARGASRPLKPARLLAIGRIKPGPEAALFARFNERLRPPLAVSEFPEARGTAAEIRRREAEALLAQLAPPILAIALDLGAPPLSTEALAAQLRQWQESGRPLAFIIGGAEGLDPTLLARADHRLSLGPLTWPHFLVRGLLAEQLYRAQCIKEGHPYHRPWRP